MHLIGCWYYWQVNPTENIYFAQIKKNKKNDLKKYALGLKLLCDRTCICINCMCPLDSSRPSRPLVSTVE